MRKTFVSLAITLLVAACASTSTTPAPSQAPAESVAPVGSAPAESAPAESAAASVPAGKDTMIIAIPGTPPGIDPNTQSAPQMWTIGAQLYGESGLRWGQAHYDVQQPVADPNKVPDFWIADTDSSHLQPGIIEACTLAPDGSKVTMQLRQGVKSAVGNEFTTADIEYGLQRSQETKAVGAFFLTVANASDLSQWKTVDKYTMEIDKGAHSLANLCPLLAHLGAAPSWMMDSVETKKHATTDDPWAANWVNQAGSWFGPYYITDWQSGKQVVLEANPNWWGAPVTIKKIIYQVVPNSADRIALLKAGKADLIEGISPTEAQSLDGQPGVRPVAVQSNKQFFAVMDNTQKPFSDLRVRQALNYSLDRQSIATNIYHDMSYPYEGMIPVTYPGFEEYHSYDFDLAKAKDLLTQAGYGSGLELTLDYSAGSPEEEQVAIAWQTSLQQIGVNLTLKKLPTSAISTEVFQKHATFAFWEDAPFLPDPVFSIQLWYASYSGAQFNHFNDPKVDAGIVTCGDITDLAQRTSCAQDLAKYISSVIPMANIAAPYFIYAVTDKVSGANFNYGLSYVVDTMSIQP